MVDQICVDAAVSILFPNITFILFLCVFREKKKRVKRWKKNGRKKSAKFFMDQPFHEYMSLSYIGESIQTSLLLTTVKDFS